MENTKKMLESIRRIGKRLSRKWRWKYARNEKEKSQLESDIKFVNRLGRIVWALYEVETAYDWLKRDEDKIPFEAEDAVFDCIRKLSLCLGELLNKHTAEQGEPL